ncbi:hypothetical protein BDV93DRAFT_563536 [Ceratobasidium sp. AG-I]|nr:hypothetical protein BDV93DRAFT_563536 [Ceratobasidium sp. AG-I]
MAGMGMNASVHVARIREKEQQGRGKDVDALAGRNRVGATKGKGRLRETADTATKGDGVKGEENEESTAPGVLKHMLARTQVMPQPPFIMFKLGGAYQPKLKPLLGNQRSVTGCECQAEYGADELHTTEACKCSLSPCGMKVFRFLQIQELAHNKDIPNLKATIEQVQFTLSALTAAHEPIMPSSEGLNQIKSIQEGVRNCLASAKGHSTTV